jgi:hypothetical protein
MLDLELRRGTSAPSNVISLLIPVLKTKKIVTELY